MVRHLRRFLSSRKYQVAPEELAHTLHEVFVLEQCNDDTPTQFQIPEAFIPQFRAKMKYYREAMILMALLSESRQKIAYRKVLSAFEEIVLGPEPTPGGLTKLETLKCAMADLQRLLHPRSQPEELTWSSGWLKGIGHVEHNPATTLLFATSWMTEYRAVFDSVRRFDVER